MNSLRSLKNVAILASFFVLTSLTDASARPQEEFKFKVSNNTSQTITKILVSQDKKTYGYFDIGKGIPAGKTVTLVWDKSTNDEDCVQYFKAVFDNDEESDPVKFNFCEEDVELEFN